MESFDQSLKHLLQHEPADFIRFGLGDPGAVVVSALPSGLPSRARDVDGDYLVACGDDRIIVHIEFHRRNQTLEELAIDVAEAQIRLFRRERLPVRSLVWDLYGRGDAAVLARRTLCFGVPREEGKDSQSVYQRVNLRGLDWKTLLSEAPPALWPLIALTRDGATEAGVAHARDAIEGRTDRSSAARADHLVLQPRLSHREHERAASRGGDGSD